MQSNHCDYSGPDDPIIHHCGECFTGIVCPICGEYVPDSEPLERLHAERSSHVTG